MELCRLLGFVGRELIHPGTDSPTGTMVVDFLLVLKDARILIACWWVTKQGSTINTITEKLPMPVT